MPKRECTCYHVPTGYLRFEKLRSKEDGTSGLIFLVSDTYHEPALLMDIDVWKKETHTPLFAIKFDSSVQPRTIANVLTKLAEDIEKIEYKEKGTT